MRFQSHSSGPDAVQTRPRPEPLEPAAKNDSYLESGNRPGRRPKNVDLPGLPRPANPLRVAEMVHELGWKALVLAGLAWMQLVLFVIFLTQSVRPIDHADDTLPVFGSAILMMMFGTVVLRLAGMWWRQASEEILQATDQSSNSTPDSPALTSPIR
ncbi:hypothetical protein BH10PLA2_BH10PLA2_09910 [soil metagenome]